MHEPLPSTSARCHELILGGQRSGKSRCAEQRAAGWLAGGHGRSAVLLVTALPGDDELRTRIARHRADRAARLPRLETVEVPVALGQAIAAESAPQRLLLVDCLTLWLTNLRMPLAGEPVGDAVLDAAVDALCAALQAAAGPAVLVSNEIGQGLAPLGADARRFVDDLGRLHQRLAALCTRVTWMVAGIAVPVKGGAA